MPSRGGGRARRLPRRAVPSRGSAPWALSTLRDTRGVVTANTEGQLRTKTWPELAKWHALAANRNWFTYTATSLFYSEQPGHERTWRVDAITWSENNTEAIAGLHNKGATRLRSVR
jgi:hypothetical protein